MEKGIGIQQHMGYAPKKCSTGRKGLEDEVESSNICRVQRCNYKGTKTEENQEQDFVSKEKLRNVWCKSCLEAWKQRNNKAENKVKCTKCERKDIIVEKKISEEERRNIWCPECRTERKQPWQDWGVIAYPEQEKVQQEREVSREK